MNDSQRHSVKITVEEDGKEFTVSRLIINSWPGRATNLEALITETAEMAVERLQELREKENS